MPDYNYNGTLLTEQDINDFAKEYDLTPEEYIEKWGIKLEEPEAPETPDFQTPPETTPAPVEVTEQAGTDLPSVDTSLGSPKKIDPKKYTEADSSQKVEMLKKEYGNMFKIQDLEDGRVRFTNSDGVEQEFNLNETSEYEGNVGLGGSMLKTTLVTNIKDIETWISENETSSEAADVFLSFGITKDNYWNYRVSKPKYGDIPGPPSEQLKIENPNEQNELLINSYLSIYESVIDPKFLRKNVDVNDVGAVAFTGWSENEIEQNKIKVFESLQKEYEEQYPGRKLTIDGFSDFYDNNIENIYSIAQANNDRVSKILAFNTELNPEFAQYKNDEYLSEYSPVEQIQIKLVQQRTSLINQIKEVKNQMSLVSNAEEVASLNKNLQKLESDLQTTSDKIDSFKSPVKTYKVTMGAGGPLSKSSEEFIGDPTIGTTYEEQITGIAEKNIESFAETNPLASYDSAKEAYNNQVVRLQLIEKEAQESNITIIVPYTVAKNLKKLGVDVDKDNKATTDYRTLRQAGLKPEDIESTFIADFRDQYESDDFVKYRMYLEEYNEQNDLGKALYMYSIAEIDPTKAEKKDTLLERAFQGAADYFGITRDLSNSDKRNIALFVNTYYPGTFTEEQIKDLEPTITEEIATEAVPGLIGVGEIIAGLTVGNKLLAATKIYRSFSLLARKGSTAAKIFKGGLELAVEEGTLTVMTGNIGDGTAFYTTKKLAQGMGPGRRWGMFGGLYNFAISGPQGATALFSAEIAREIDILEPHLLEQIDKIIDDKDLDRQYLKNLINFQLYGGLSLKKSDFTGRKGIYNNYLKLKTKATDAFNNAQELQGDLKQKGVTIQRGNEYKVVSESDAAKYNQYYEFELIAQARNNYINNSPDLRVEGTEQKLNESLITTFNKQLKQEFGDNAVTTNLKFDSNLQGDNARFNDRTGEILVDPEKSSLSEIYHELDHARSNEMLKNDPKAYRQYVHGLMFELKNLQIGVDENGKPVTGGKLESLIENDPQYKDQIKKNPDVFYREYMAFLMQYATKPEFYASKTGLIKEVKDYFKMWYGDKSHTPTTAQQWIDKLSLFGAKERYNLGSDPIYKKLAYINLDETEALEQEFGENTANIIEVLSSRDLNEKEFESNVSKQQKEAEKFFKDYEEKLKNGGTINKEDFWLVVDGMARAHAYNRIFGSYQDKMDAAMNVTMKLMASDYLTKFNSKEYIDSGGTPNNDMMGFVANKITNLMRNEVRRLAQESERRTQDFPDIETLERAMENNSFASEDFSETSIDGLGEGLPVGNTPVYIDKVFPQAIIKSEQIAVPKGVVNYANLKPQNFEILIDQLGLRAEPVLKLNGNINKGATKKATTQNIREWFTQEYNGPEKALQGMTNGQILYELLPLSQRKMFEGDKSSTKIFDSILDALYVKDTARKLVTEGAPPSGPVEQLKLPWQGGGKEAFESALASDTFVNAMMSEFTKAAANQKYRVDLKEKGAAEQELQKIADGKSDWLASKRLDKDFTPEREQDYKNAAADINKIKVTDEAGIIAISDVLKKYNINSAKDVKHFLQQGLLTKYDNIDLAKEFLEQISMISENFGLTPIESIDAFAQSQVTKRGVFKLLNLEGVEIDLETQRGIDLQMMKHLIPEGTSFSELDLQSQRDLLTQIGYGVPAEGAKGLEIYFKQYNIDHKALGDKKYGALFDVVFKSQGITASDKIGLNESMSLTDFSKTNIIQNPGLSGLGKEIKNIMDSGMSEKEQGSAIRNILTRPGVDFNETVKANSKLAVSTYKAPLDAIKANPKNAKNIIVGWYNTMGLNMQRQPSRQRPYQYVSETIGKGIWSEHFEAYAQTNADMARVYDAYANGKITYDQAVGIIEARVGSQTMSFIDRDIAKKVDLTYTKTGKGTPIGGAVYFNYGKYLDIATGDIVDPSIAAAQITSRLNNKYEGPIYSVLDALIKANIETRQTVENVRESNVEVLNNNEAFSKENTDGLTSAQVISIAENLEALPPVTLASRNLSQESAEIISSRTGIQGEVSASEAALKGKKGKKVGILPYTVKDVYGLLRVLARKGEQGEADIKFFDENLMQPYRQGVAATKKYKNNLLADNGSLRKKYGLEGSLTKKSQLKKKIADTEYTYDHAVRVWIWDKQGMEIPGLSDKQKSLLLRAVNGDKNLAAFATELISITKKDGFVDPGDMWYEGNITSDLLRGVRKNTRPRFLRVFSENWQTIFDKQALNKLEAAYGTDYVSSLDSFYTRGMSGSNMSYTIFGRKFGGGRLFKQLNARLQEANAVTMWFNMSSAVGQLVSVSNYVDMKANNPYRAAMAVANIPQYAKDIYHLLNSDYIKARYKDLTIGVTESEISEALSGSTNIFASARSLFLKKGFLPSQSMDLVSILLGGATLYRNNKNYYLFKDGMSELEAEVKAKGDWEYQTDKAQQSADPSRTSAESSELTGKALNAFGTVPQQSMRIIDNKLMDIANGRGNMVENWAVIAYYGIAQSAGFNYVSNTLWTGIFEEEPSDEEQAKNQATKNQEKLLRGMNGTINTWFKGFGARGALLAAAKDYILDIYSESQKDMPDYIESAYVLLSAMPALQTKMRQLRGAGADIQYAGGFEEALDEEWNLQNPYLSAGTKLVSFGTNMPTDKALAKMNNIEAALEDERKYWEAIALLLGYSKYRLGIEEETISERKQREAEEAVVNRNRLFESLTPDERGVFLKMENIQKQRKQREQQTPSYLEREKMQSMTPEELYQYLGQKRKQKGFNID